LKTHGHLPGSSVFRPEPAANHLKHFVLPRLALRRGRIAAHRPVRDHNGQALSYIYYVRERESLGGGQTKLLTWASSLFRDR
jgi:hypothetical protein